MTTQMMKRMGVAMVAASMLASVALPLMAAPTTQPAAPSTQPSAPSTQPSAYVVPDELTGAQLAFQAQVAFNRGEYAKALPLLQKAAKEVADQPAKLSSLQERIRVAEKALAAATANPNAAGADATLTPPTAEARKPLVAPKAGEVLELAIKDLGNFEYDQEKGGNVPADIKALAGSKIRIRGFMIPMDQAENITQFALVPSLFACCFGQPPQIQHTIVVSCPKGKAVGYSPDEIVCEGTLKVQEKKDDGYIVSLFEMEVISVKAAPK